MSCVPTRSSVSPSQLPTGGGGASSSRARIARYSASMCSWKRRSCSTFCVVSASMDDRDDPGRDAAEDGHARHEDTGSQGGDQLDRPVVDRQPRERDADEWVLDAGEEDLEEEVHEQRDARRKLARMELVPLLRQRREL